MPNVVLTSSGSVATVTLNRPATLNTLNPPLIQELHSALHSLKNDASVGVIVIRGTGEHFMAGGDIKFFQESLADISESSGMVLTPFFKHAHGVIETIRDLKIPVICSVRGAAAGYGLSLLLASDLVIASDTSKFTTAYSHIGLSPDGGSTYFLPRLVGNKRATELFFLAERFDASRALELGLINRVVPDSELETATDELAAKLVRGPAKAYARTKALINSSFYEDFVGQLKAEQDSFIASALTSDFAEGVNAFCEKRQPKFGDAFQ